MFQSHVSAPIQGRGIEMVFMLYLNEDYLPLSTILAAAVRPLLTSVASSPSCIYVITFLSSNVNTQHAARIKLLDSEFRQVVGAS